MFLLFHDSFGVSLVAAVCSIENRVNLELQLGLFKDGITEYFRNYNLCCHVLWNSNS